MRTPLTGMAMIGNALKNFLRGLGLLATFAAALAMAQQSTSSENHTNARPHSNSGASTWGPTRNPTPSTTPRASSASSIREPYSVKAPSSLTGVDRKASTPETVGHAGGGAASSGGTPPLASSGGVHASVSQRKASKKTHPGTLSSSTMNRRKALESMGIHPHAKAGAHKSKKHRTF